MSFIQMLRMFNVKKTVTVKDFWGLTPTLSEGIRESLFVRVIF